MRSIVCFPILQLDVVIYYMCNLHFSRFWIVQVAFCKCKHNNATNSINAILKLRWKYWQNVFKNVMIMTKLLTPIEKKRIIDILRSKFPILTSWWYSKFKSLQGTHKTKPQIFDRFLTYFLPSLFAWSIEHTFKSKDIFHISMRWQLFKRFPLLIPHFKEWK